MEPLIFKIETQADDSGVRQYDKSLGGLDVSSKKASGALKSFSHELLQAKSGADVAAAGAESLSRVLEKSLAGAVVIGAVKIISDQINKMAEILRSVGEATGAAVTQLERMGEIRGIEDAVKGVGILDQTIDGVTQKLGSIKDGNWFTKITASVTGTTDELKAQQATLERIRDGMIEEGLLAEKLNAERNDGISEEQKLYDQVATKLKEKLALAEKIGDEAGRQNAIQSANAIADIERTNLSIKLGEERAKKEADQADATQKNIDAQIKKEQQLAEVQQKRFNDLYDAEVKAQEATQKRVDANLKAEQDLADQQKGLQDELAAAKGATPGGGGGGGGGGGASIGVGGTTPGLGIRSSLQKQSSAEVGAAASQARAFEKGRQEATAQYRANIADQLKAQGKESGGSAVTNEIMKRGDAVAEASGKASEGLGQYNDRIQKARQDIADFKASTAKASESTSTFSSKMSDLVPSFDSVMKGANNLADAIMENTGNMVGDFLNTGSKASDLGENFSDLGKSASDLADVIEKVKPGAGPADQGGKKGGGDGAGSLASIEKLLQKNFDELKAYAHAT
jgi:hypothetical protein